MPKALAIVTLAVLTAACAGESRAPVSSPRPTFNRGTVLIDTGGDTVLLHALFAQTDEQRSYGLTAGPSLPQDGAMVFVFFHAATGPVPRDGATRPLSVAFFDVDGRILRIVDVEPCPATPCSVASPGVSYMGAIAVRRGLFDELGVAAGDVVHPVPGGE